MFKKLKVSNLITFISKRNFSLCGSSLNRKPPKEEFEKSLFTRPKGANPFNKRFKWTPKSAEPYNVRGGHPEWVQLPFLHRGVQRPGYLDPDSKKFIFVAEMVPELIVPKDLKNCQLKPYVPYNVDEIKTPVFDSKQLYEATLEKDLISDFASKKLATNENQ